ncbi:MAG: hypothetical protein ACI8UO_001819 [Verrucomicrobiales bacterium]|jgi:hypothetical protein
MENSIFIARLLAVVYLVCGLGFLIKPREFEKLFDEFRSSASAWFFSGLLALIVGFLLIHFHNIWDSSWRVVITLFGWVGLIKGCVILIFPASVFDPIFKARKGLMKLGWTLSLAFGAFFGWFGFFG